ncbi:MAG: hypothetical protein HOY76_23315 [Streptomyces sp.]|nr:hypothetical protein [Streptomyces sp.]
MCLLLDIGQGAAWGWGSARVVGLLLGAAVALAAFAAVELRVGAPLVTSGCCAAGPRRPPKW